jgi:hypothetical protein
MNSDIVKAIISFVVLGVIGIVLLAGAGTGAIAIPKGFGLFDQSDWVVRIITLVILLVVAFVLYRVYSGAKSSS